MPLSTSAACQDCASRDQQPEKKKKRLGTISRKHHERFLSVKILPNMNICIISPLAHGYSSRPKGLHKPSLHPSDVKAAETTTPKIFDSSSVAIQCQCTEVRSGKIHIEKSKY